MKFKNYIAIISLLALSLSASGCTGLLPMSGDVALNTVINTVDSITKTVEKESIHARKLISAINKKLAQLTYQEQVDDHSKTIKDPILL